MSAWKHSTLYLTIWHCVLHTQYLSRGEVEGAVLLLQQGISGGCGGEVEGQSWIDFLHDMLDPYWRREWHNFPVPTFTSRWIVLLSFRQNPLVCPQALMKGKGLVCLSSVWNSIQIAVTISAGGDMEAFQDVLLGFVVPQGSLWRAADALLTFRLPLILDLDETLVSAQTLSSLSRKFNEASKQRYVIALARYDSV